jgi:hypothetical protein
MRPWLNGKRPLALALTVFTLHALPAGCASRVVPGRYPPTSAASVSAPQARPAVVNGALTEDPPLPGQPSTLWPGLVAEEATHPPTGHGGHHGH